MNAFIVFTYAAVAWLILVAIKNVRHDSRQRREQSSWLAGHERQIRSDQTRREADESAPIVWRQ